MLGHSGEFFSSLLAYLNRQRELELADIEASKHLSEEEKIETGLLIKQAEVSEVCGKEYSLSTPEDNTKLRVGDKVKLHKGTILGYAKIVDLGVDSLCIETDMQLSLGDKIDVEIEQHMMLDPLIELMGSIDDGRPGASFIKMLAGDEAPSEKGLGAVSLLTAKSLFASLNELQRKAAEDCLKRPSVYCLQGPPGTGKTAVLSAVAQAFALANKEVLIIANTHQAVNNALNKVASAGKKLAIVKVGESIKAEGLHEGISIAETYNAYLADRKKDKRKYRTNTPIVGMTFHAAVINLGLRNTGFKPKIVLVDEAGQMPMAYASLIGTFGCGSVAFFGDDKQMPPIFHPQLIGSPYSQSIFAYLCGLYPQLRHMLNVTYRMNDEITLYISKNFYEVGDDGFSLISSEYSSHRRLEIDGFTKESMQIVEVEPDTENMLADVSPTEAKKAVELAHKAVKNGLPLSDVAIITPYRRQVKYIRSLWNDLYPEQVMPLVNTVECLQGQDVEMIIISLVANDMKHLMDIQLPFILDKNRLNVMISRAKTKVILLMSNDLENVFKR